MAYHFKKIGKKYYLTDHVGILLQTMLVVGVILKVVGDDADREVELLKYGDAYVMENIWKEKYLRMDKEPNTQMFLFTGKFDVEELNKLIEKDTYAKIFYSNLLNAYKEYSEKQKGKSK